MAANFLMGRRDYSRSPARPARRYDDDRPEDGMRYRGRGNGRDWTRGPGHGYSGHGGRGYSEQQYDAAMYDGDGLGDGQDSSGRNDNPYEDGGYGRSSRDRGRYSYEER